MTLLITILSAFTAAIFITRRVWSVSCVSHRFPLAAKCVQHWSYIPDQTKSVSWYISSTILLAGQFHSARIKFINCLVSRVRFKSFLFICKEAKRTGGKARVSDSTPKSDMCNIRLSHDRWGLSVKLAEARWAQQQARDRELEEVKDFLQWKMKSSWSTTRHAESKWLKWHDERVWRPAVQLIPHNWKNLLCIKWNLYDKWLD